MTTTPTAGEALRRTQDGSLPIGTVEEILKRAPSDIVEAVLPVPEWKCSVRVRSFTAAQSAQVKQHSLKFREQGTDIAWADMEITQFLEGVVEPRFTREEATHLHSISGKGFQRVINWLDENSGTDKEALSKARDEFPRSGNDTQD